LERSIASSLCRFRISDEHLISDNLVKGEIARAFSENRCYDFYLIQDIISDLKTGTPVEVYREQFIDIRNKIFDLIANGDQTQKNILLNDVRLSSRIVLAMAFLHRAVAEGNFSTIVSRRFVIVKEPPRVPTLFHISTETTVIAHVGQGPPWGEIPTIYLGLKLFDALLAEQKKGETGLFKAFQSLLMIEERAIETGYTHIEVYPFEVSQSLNFLVDSVIEYARIRELEAEEVIPLAKKVPPFTEENRKKFLRDFNARLKKSELDFNYERNLKAIKSLESMARRYKKSNDMESLREVIRLLVAVSGHDIHEIRNRANIILERVFAPKDFDAPLATRFINLHIGEAYSFTFKLPRDDEGYFIRIFKNRTSERLFLEKDIAAFDIPLTWNKAAGAYSATHTFNSYGHYDFLVYQKSKSPRWINLQGTSGRVNVIPDLRGEIILEIFADIHGHTKTYWHDETGHPGLVYNENGQVIRLGTFADITEHLPDIKIRYQVTEIYLLGVQKRGSNREDWAPEASSPSPFSPMSLVDIEPSLGGEKDFIDLVKRAHALDIRIIVDIIPHINRKSDHLADDLMVYTYNHEGGLVIRASTDGRYGSWNDGILLNYRKFEIWEWMADSVETLIEKFDIDGIRFDSAHAVPIMMKKNNYLYTYDKKREHDEMVEGSIIVNDREDDHYITTGYYDCACRDLISVPFHFYLMQRIERKLRLKKKKFFINIAECYWGHERFLTRTGLIPYNSSLFKICENIIHGKTDVREIYHIYDNYFPSVLPEGTELLGILGNHDERRALNTFGHRGLRAAVPLTCFMSNIIMDYEGSAEGEGWKVFLDNIYVNWNQFEYASHRSLDTFYGEWYKFQRTSKGRGCLVWANNTMVVAAVKFTGKDIWVGAFNFADSNQTVDIQFDSPVLPISDDACYRVVDPLYSGITRQYSYFTGAELKISRVNTVVSYTERVKLLKLEHVSLEENYHDFFMTSFFRLCTLSDVDKIESNFAFSEIARNCATYDKLRSFIRKTLVPLLWENHLPSLELGVKRAAYHIHKRKILDADTVLDYGEKMLADADPMIREIGESLRALSQRGLLVFMSAEAMPFSKSGGLANVVYELPREMVRLGEKVCVISGFYRHGDDKAVKNMMANAEKYGIAYTGKNVRFKIENADYDVGVHSGDVDGVTYYLLDHHEFFDGLYWGVTSEEKIRRRIAFARACAELIIQFDLRPRYTFTNDAYSGLFNGIVRCDHFYSNNPNFNRNTYLHVIHNGGWQYFDAYSRHERGKDLFGLFNLPPERVWEFCDPYSTDRINCMASGIRFADRVITVSPSYAKQIEYACDGMEHLLYNVIGISNAIGADFREKMEKRFNESGFIENTYYQLVEKIKAEKHLHDKIETRYPELLKGINALEKVTDPNRRAVLWRMRNKLSLQHSRGLMVDPDKILFAFIHRISEQKGFQLLLEASEGIFKHLGFQGIVGGAVASGDRKGDEIAHGLYLLSRDYQALVDVSFGFQDVTIPLLGADLFLMPSMHEPGGISQLEAFAAGCLVLARATGGLRDTVFPIRVNEKCIDGNGFLFSDYTPWAFYDAMSRASSFFKSSDESVILQARHNAESSAYFWDRPARQYIEKIYDLTESIRIIRPAVEYKTG